MALEKKRKKIWRFLLDRSLPPYLNVFESMANVFRTLRSILVFSSFLSDCFAATLKATLQFLFCVTYYFLG